MDYQLVMLPLEAGGTCILDYDLDMQEQMEKSIVLCGREDLVLCSVPVVFPGKCSLHLISDNTNLDDFWEACVTISEDE